ncbi:P-loop containing nucleoside triphosphate hydrolase protein [Mrakia frigida]|uniref:P-loop containing nucleoside triphosphate hydrolase protein n=1 Tax=Mrakia frigida TaxID=29902 RepID=UPI003FCC0454
MANTLVMGSSGAVSTPPRNPKPKAVVNSAQGLQTGTPKKKIDTSDFVFKSSPLTRSPQSASKFTSHPTLTHLPQAFTSPPIRDGLLSSLRQYLTTDGNQDDSQPAQNRLFRPTPIQRLTLGHFFDAPMRVEPARGGTKGRMTQQHRKFVENPSETPRGMKLGSKTLLAAETGSGKTVAYALPIIEALKASEPAGQHIPSPWIKKRDVEPDFLEAMPFGARPSSDPDLGPRKLRSPPPPPRDGPILQPRALILAPTHELARQIAQAIKVLSHNVKLRITCLSAGSGTGQDRGSYAFHPGTDVVVGTIGRVREMMGLSGFRDENMEERREKLASEHQIEVIKKEARAAKLMTDRSFGVEGKKDPWVPDRRLTWAENLDERKRLEDEGLVERGMDPTKRPSWDKPVLKGRRSVPPAEAKKVFMGLDKVEWIAIDEADIVLNPDFIDHTEPVLNPLFKRVKPPHLILATATIPETLANYIQKHHPETTRLITPNLHRLPHNLAVSKVTWSGGNWKADVLLELRRSFVEDARNGKLDSQVIVFINKNIKAEFLGEYLEEHGITNVVMTGDSQLRGRGSNRHISDFIISPTQFLKEKLNPPPATPPVKFVEEGPKPRVLVTTGMLSRGMDFSPKISTAMLCDEPRNAVDFIHRAGRVGRAGNSGRVIIFTKEKQKTVIRHGGGAGRGGAMYKTIMAAKARYKESHGGRQKRK